MFWCTPALLLYEFVVYLHPRRAIRHLYIFSGVPLSVEYLYLRRAQPMPSHFRYAMSQHDQGNHPVLLLSAGRRRVPLREADVFKSLIRGGFFSFHPRDLGHCFHRLQIPAGECHADFQPDA